MSIERDPNIVFDPDGTLRATTNWISKHDEGLAELLKNVRFAYLPNWTEKKLVAEWCFGPRETTWTEIGNGFALVGR